MAEIKELGESLLSRAKDRNKRNYERGRKEAYKIALLTAGSSMLSNSIKSKATDFMNSEEMMAQRAKQNAGYQDAQRYIAEQNRIDAVGIPAEQYFEEQMLPMVRERALEQVKELGLDEDSLSLYIREQARTLGIEKAKAHSEGFEAASGVSSPEDFAAFQTMASRRLASNTSWLTNSVRKIFGGKTREEIEADTINSISQSPLLTNAESVAELRKAYNQTGDLSIAVQAAEAVESGRIKEGTAPRIWKRAGTSTSHTGPSGEVVTEDNWDAVDSNGNVISDEEGNPITLKKISDVKFGAIKDQEFSRYIDRLTDGQKAEQSNILSFVATNGSSDLTTVYGKYIELVGGDAAPVVERAAAVASKMQADHGISEEASQRLSAQILLNQVQAGWTEKGTFNFGKFDFSDVNSSSTPNSLDLIEAMGQLEGTAADVTITFDELGSLLRTVNQDLGKGSDAEIISQINYWSSRPEQYGFLFEANAEGASAIDIIADHFGLTEDPDAGSAIEPTTTQSKESLDDSNIARDSSAFRTGQLVRRDIGNVAELAGNIIKSPFRVYKQLGSVFDEATEEVREDVSKSVSQKLSDFSTGFERGQ